MRHLPDLVRALRWHRRLLAALIATGATLVALTALTRPAPGLETAAVVVARRPIEAGASVAADDLEVVQRPVSTLPDAALREPGAAVGRVVGAGVPRGQVLTEPNLLVSQGADGRLVVGVRVSDPDLARLAPAGTRVTLFAAGSAEPVVSQVLVRAVPSQTSGLSSQSGLLLVEVDAAQAAAIAAVSSQTALTVALG